MPATLRMAERRAESVNPLHPRDPALADMFGASWATASGESVTSTTAMQEETVLACERYIGESIAGLPKSVLEALKPMGFKKLSDHWVSRRLSAKPNQFMYAFHFFDLLMNWLIMDGNWYVRPVPSRVMPPFELIPLHPRRVRPYFGDDGLPRYEYTPPRGPRETLRHGELWHIPFMPDDGLKGKSVIQYAREKIGANLAATRYEAANFGNNAMPSGIIKLKKKLDREARREIGRDWNEKHRGAGNAGRVAVVNESDFDFEPLSWSMADAQWADAERLGVISICRIFNVPPHKVKALDRATWNNIEEQNIDAVTDTLLPWCIRIEQSGTEYLLTDEERSRGLTLKLNLDGLLRGDFKTRQEGLQIMRQNGVINGHDWARLENMEPPEGGDVYIVPMNMIDITQLGQEPSPPTRGDAEGSSPAAADGSPARELVPAVARERSLTMLRRLRSAHHASVEDAARRLFRREADVVERTFNRYARERTMEDFTEWLDNYYGEQREGVMATMSPSLSAFAAAIGTEAAGLLRCELPDLDAFVRSYATGFASRHADGRREVMRALASESPEAIPAAVTSLLEGWRSDWPSAVAWSELVQLGAATGRFVWQAAGIRRLRWTRVNDCPRCGPECDGQVAGINDVFDGRGVGHPPSGPGCTCTVLPA